MSNKHDSQSDVLEQTKTKTPPLYNVILWNDDKTTIEFVVYVLSTVFRKSKEEAYELTLYVHDNGSAVAGVYTKEIAEEKTETSVELARKNGFPLVVTFEEQ